MYELQIERTAERDLDRLPPEKYDPILLKIKALAHDPRPSGCGKLAGSRNDWRIRLGDYRILYEILDSIRVVRILRVRHRREVYR